ncbi:MAG TPA: MFS transporter [Steroidobacteraceae bacterium]|nr:MFS transporter [Steroidobacteraceae bacterium]
MSARGAPSIIAAGCTRSLELRAEIEQLPFGGRHVLIVIALAAATLFDGYDVFVPGYVIPFATRAWRLLPSEAGLLVSSGLVGFMLGSLVNGASADRLGRRPTLLLALLLAGAGNIATALWGHSFVRFLALRALTGVGLGVILPVTVTLINELAPRRALNLVVGWVMVGWSLGGVAASLAAWALLPALGWPALFALGGLALPLAGVLALVLPESPHFLVVEQRQEAVGRVMSSLYPLNSARYSQAHFSLPEDTAHRGSFARLLTPTLRRSTLIVWLCSALSLFSIFGLSSWTPQIMLERGEAFGASVALGGELQLASLLGGLGCGWAADRRGRATTLLVAWSCGAAAALGLALINLHATNIAFVGLAGFFVPGAQIVLNNRTAALYDTEIRSTGVGAQLGVGRLGGILGPYVGGLLRQVFPGSTALFIFIACALACCALVSLLLPRESVLQPRAADPS